MVFILSMKQRLAFTHVTRLGRTYMEDSKYRDRHCIFMTAKFEYYLLLCCIKLSQFINCDRVPAMK